ncbi:uncharacterized protein [Diadema antillarum]|uniref:uncharacterized protein n=1 Tax=Diadema antillarum TaxID=105358 RepID=UPI003A887A84
MPNTYELRKKTMPGPTQRGASASSTQRPDLPDDASSHAGTSGGDPQPTLADLQKSLNAFSSKVCAKLEDIHTDLASMKKRMLDLESAVADNSARVLDLEKGKLPETEAMLKEEIDALKEKLTLSEIYQRKGNLLFYGLHQAPNEDVYAVLRGAFVTLGLSQEESASIALVNAHRLPQRNAATSSPQPIIAKFVYMYERNRVLATYEGRTTRRGTPDDGAQTRGPRISVRTDLPPALKAKRSVLAAKAYKMRKDENLSTKITLVGTKVVLFSKAKNTTAWQAYKE